MKSKWIPIIEDYKLEDMAIVTRLIKNYSGQKISDVTVGYPGWGLQSSAIAYAPLPNNIVQEPETWKSEYRNDELPKRDKSFLVCLTGTESYNGGKFKIIDSFYLAKENKFLRIPDGWEVIGWTEYPNPYNKR